MNKKPNYADLKKIWYKKLKESGFRDIEYDNPLLLIERGYPNSADYKDAFLRDATEAYYRMCLHFLNAHEFQNPIEKTMWEYHSEGLGVRAITTTLAKINIKTNRTAVWLIIKKHQKIMKQLYLRP